MSHAQFCNPCCLLPDTSCLSQPVPDQEHRMVELSGVGRYPFMPEAPMMGSTHAGLLCAIG